MAKAIMICGTGSHVGKSVIVAGLCRIFKQDGFKTAPFKSQNMALNSFVTEQGGEIGRAQAVQAMAAGIKPHVDMNPILLKPGSDTGAQVIVLGCPVGNMEAQEYDGYKSKVFETAQEAFGRLSSGYDIIVMEGAGSPAEINLKDDIANIKMADAAGAPVILAGDIDLGGVFSWLYGTIELLPEEQRRRVRAFVINKFRGDFDILKPGLKMLEDKTGVPVLGVIPYIRDLQIDEEDSVACSRFSGRPFKGRDSFGPQQLPEKGRKDSKQVRGKSTISPAKTGSSDGSGAVSSGEGNCPGRIKIEVLYLPHISNFTDFDPLNRHPWVRLRYVRPGDSLSCPDVVIIPGTKNTIGDLKFLYDNGYVEAIKDMALKGVFVIGICGGYQMLGKAVSDPGGHESGGTIKGLGFLSIMTVFKPGKVTGQVRAVSTGQLPFYSRDEEIDGYEIHMGESEYLAGTEALFYVHRKGAVSQIVPDGAVNKGNNVWGTYVHGLFDRPEFTRAFLMFVAEKRKISLGAVPEQSFNIDTEFDRLADIIRTHVDIKKIYEIMGIPA